MPAYGGFSRTAVNGPLLIVANSSTGTVLEFSNTSAIPETGDADSNPYTTSGGQSKTALIKGTDLTTLTGGQKIVLQFLQQNIATSQASAAMKISDVAGVTQIAVPFAGSIIGIAACGNANITASTIRFIPTVNGATITGMGAQNAATTVKVISKSQAKDTSGSTFAVGDRLGVKVTTTASYAPATADWTCALYIES